jgi:hypothetical protein
VRLARGCRQQSHGGAFLLLLNGIEGACTKSLALSLGIFALLKTAGSHQDSLKSLGEAKTFLSSDR